MGTDKYTASILLPWDDDRTVSDYEYDNEEDAEWHMRMRWRNYFDSEEHFKNNLCITATMHFTRKWFTRSLTPWCACFVNGELQEFVNTFWEGMQERYIWIDPKVYGNGEIHYWVYFWASPDEDKAIEIAKGYLQGYLLGKAKNS